jgi:hypothetical protein
MSRFLCALAMLCATLPVSLPAAEKAAGYEAFRMVRTRNIFDPNRRAVPRSEASPRAASATRSRPNSFTLTGTMVTERRTLAFFSGSRPEYSKVISVGENVGDFKLTKIATSQVELERDGKPLALEVGRPHELEGTVEVPVEADSAPSPGDTPAAPAESSTPAAAAPAPAASGDKNEILRRLMERRAKEMSK